MSRQSLSLDELRTKSWALADFLQQQSQQQSKASHTGLANRQISAVTGNDAGPAVYDIHTIWRAALADPEQEDTVSRRRHMSPVYYCNGWDFMISAREDVGTGRNRHILVDRRAALDYVQMVDRRVMRANIETSEDRANQELARDPIGHIISACRGGPLALLFVWTKARVAAGMESDEFESAVLARAKELASSMEPIAAETLVHEVKQAVQNRQVGITYQTDSSGESHVVD